MQRLPILTAVRLPAEQADALKRLSASTGRTESALHRQAIATFLAAQVTGAPATHPPQGARREQ